MNGSGMHENNTLVFFHVSTDIINGSDIAAQNDSSFYFQMGNELTNKTVANSTARRRLLSTGEPDLHLKDLELLLRGIALLVNRTDYAPSMVRFLNQFSIKAKKHTSEQNEYLSELSCSFFDQCNALPPDAFVNKKNRRFNTAVFEAVFVAACTQPFLSRRLLNRPIDLEPLQNLENDSAFLDAMKEGTTQTKNVNDRIRRAEEILGSF
jgi:hypothetical protein